MIKDFIKILLLSVVVFMIATGFTAKNESLKPSEDDSETMGSLGLYYTVLNEDEIEDEDAMVFSLFLGKTFLGFKEALGFKESRGKYFIVNEFGYLGKYQFGAATLRTIGVYSPNSFINSPKLQEKAFEANLSRNKWVLRKEIKRYAGKVVRGVKVTESGILAAAHLGGPGNVKKFLRSNGRTVFADAYGSSIKYYMKKFAGYDTSCIQESKKAKVVYLN